MTRTLVVFDNDSHGEGRSALVATLLARMPLANEVSYLLAVDDVLGFLEASARPVSAWRVMFDPAPIRGAGDVCEGFVKAHHGVLPAFSIGVSYLVAFLAYHVPVAFAYAGVGFNLLCGKYRRY